MGLAAAFGHWNHWGMVVEWPDDGAGRTVLTDSMFSIAPPSAGLRSQWTVAQMMNAEGLSKRVSAVFFG
jgi:hypothetical protein